MVKKEVDKKTDAKKKQVTNMDDAEVHILLDNRELTPQFEDFDEFPDVDVDLLDASRYDGLHGSQGSGLSQVATVPETMSGKRAIADDAKRPAKKVAVDMAATEIISLAKAKESSPLKMALSPMELPVEAKKAASPMKKTDPLMKKTSPVKSSTSIANAAPITIDLTESPARAPSGNPISKHASPVKRPASPNKTPTSHNPKKTKEAVSNPDSSSSIPTTEGLAAEADASKDVKKAAYRQYLARGGPIAPGTKELPIGDPDCLAVCNFFNYSFHRAGNELCDYRRIRINISRRCCRFHQATRGVSTNEWKPSRTEYLVASCQCRVLKPHL